MSVQRHAVLIASSKFPLETRLQELRCPENDVDGLKDVLSDPQHGAFSSVTVLKNRPHHEALLKINQTLKSAGKEDIVLVYYSGHGKLDPAGRLHLATENTEIDALEATSIPVESIRNFVDVANTTKVVLILDCCFSGAVGAAFMRSGVDDQLQRVTTGRGTYLMTASTAIQVALEKEEDDFGVFTKHIVQGIKTGEADLDGDGRVTMDELYRYVHGKVLDEGFQEPMKWDLNVRGDLVIANAKPIQLEDRRKKIRQKLHGLAAKGYIADDLVFKALELSAVRPSERTEIEKKYNGILDDFLAGTLSVAELTKRWTGLKETQPIVIKPPPKITPVVDPDVEPSAAVEEEPQVEAEKALTEPIKGFDIPVPIPPKTKTSGSGMARRVAAILTCCYCGALFLTFLFWIIQPFDPRLTTPSYHVGASSSDNVMAIAMIMLLTLFGVVLSIVSGIFRYWLGLVTGAVLNPIAFCGYLTLFARESSLNRDTAYWGLYLLVAAFVGFRALVAARKYSLPEPT